MMAFMPFHCMLKLKKANSEEIPLGCKLSFPQFDHDRKCSVAPVVSDHRVIAIGDIHGSYTGLLEDLYYSNITRGRNECVWKEQSTKTVLVQMGDLVDRGPGALEALKCLRKLQREASKFNGEVVRLLGSKNNHLDSHTHTHTHTYISNHTQVNLLFEIIIPITDLYPCMYVSRP
ncbi:hypothetical protein EON63_18585 [archaeon]|nr:MAG: hypothetical protein EON63_18585 [archaeon]